ncbi:30S ribosome-binding factor RbfA [Levyella massiliensis]|uniref:30S ribosome-binding factor RbfA n=1 Tax=Levyella massiliensis TaxID=938289 RepID=UPI00037C0C5B|nr:30S ribosome-binding factor RbfA [Levyella massiliensis]
MNEKRLGRISQEVKKALSEAIFFELKDPKISTVLTLSEVRVSNDLSYTDVYVSVMGSDWDQRQTLEGLENAQGFLKNYLAHHVKIRQIPELRFHLDDSIEHGMYMDKLIAETMRKDAENQAARGESVPGEGGCE